MELNAKISALEDEVKLLKGEVKVILSEIRAAILGQDNPFSPESGQRLQAYPDAPEARPPIRVVKLPTEDEEEVYPSGAASTAEAAPEALWPEEEPLTETRAEVPLGTRPEPEPMSPPVTPAPRSQESIPRTPPPQVAEPAPTARPEPVAVPPRSTPSWSLITVAGVAAWAEDALKQLGPERLQILLDLCEFAGYLPKAIKEALIRVTNLGLAIDERETPLSVNECLVILCQLDALMRGEEPAGGLSHSRVSAMR